MLTMPVPTRRPEERLDDDRGRGGQREEHVSAARCRGAGISGAGEGGGGDDAGEPAVAVGE